MEIKLYLNKDINYNANYYFEKAKKLKAKIPGLDIAMQDTQNQINNLIAKKDIYLSKRDKEKKIQVHKKREWFEKFRWTITSNNLLCVLGLDSGTNEILIKKHTESNDIVMHTSAPGSPFGIIKNGKEKAEKEDIEECAEFLSCFSSQWKKGYGTAEVFWVLPDQVSKKAQSGEFLSKGSFMIYGNKNILKNVKLQICLGVIEEEIKTEDDETIKYEKLFSGSQRACEKFCKKRFIKLEPGLDTYKALTKEIKKRLKTHVEDLPKYIPNNCKILKK